LVVGGESEYLNQILTPKFNPSTLLKGPCPEKKEKTSKTPLECSTFGMRRPLKSRVPRLEEASRSACFPDREKHAGVD